MCGHLTSWPFSHLITIVTSFLEESAIKVTTFLAQVFDTVTSKYTHFHWKGKLVTFSRRNKHVFNTEPSESPRPTVFLQFTSSLTPEGGLVSEGARSIGSQGKLLTFPKGSGCVRGQKTRRTLPLQTGSETRDYRDDAVFAKLGQEFILFITLHLKYGFDFSGELTWEIKLVWG